MAKFGIKAEKDTRSSNYARIAQESLQVEELP